MFNHKRLTKAREQAKINKSNFVFVLYELGLKISRQTLINWEQGVSTPSADSLATMARALNKPIEYFFTRKHNKTV